MLSLRDRESLTTSYGVDPQGLQSAKNCRLPPMYSALTLALLTMLHVLLSHMTVGLSYSGSPKRGNS